MAVFEALCKKRIRHKLSISSLYSDPCCSVMIASLRDFFFLLRSSTHLMSTKFKEQMIMTTLHHHQTYYTNFKASWVTSILEFWAVSLFILAVCFFISSGIRVPGRVCNMVTGNPRTREKNPWKQAQGRAGLRFSDFRFPEPDPKEV